MEGEADRELHLFNSWRESGRVSEQWQPSDSSGAVIKVRVHNKQLLAYLRELKPGRWQKVYREGRDGTQVHYFEHASGAVAGVKHKAR